MMKKVGRVILLWLLLLFMLHAEGTCYSLPGKPTLKRCRSPEKETFTCWWEPGSDGGLPTNYALYYRKENSDTVYECPDYFTAGENSCFFNKNDTSIWVNYNITVVATNTLGSTFSDPIDIDVVYIVMPNSPENVAVTVSEDKGWPFLRVSWEPPPKADTRSGWITLIYELRIKLEGEDEWEMHLAGQQKVFNIFSLRSGGTYLVQVRCKPDHGFWSEWSSTTYVKVPDYFHREKSVWILMTIFAALVFFILTWLIHMNSHNLKHCLLPPVPGPKIKGFDKQLLKNGKSESIFNSLAVSVFPPTTSPNYEDLLVEYLEVYVPEERELILQENKNLQNCCLKSGSSTSDSDSGRGSCDSHTLLMDKCGETKEKDWVSGQQSAQVATDAQSHDEVLEVKAQTYTNDDVVSPYLSSGRVKTWPSVFSPLPQYSLHPLDQPRSLEMAKQHCLSDSLFPPGSLSSYLGQPGHSTKGGLGSNYMEFSFSNQQPKLVYPQREIHQKLQAHSDINISHTSCKGAPAGQQLPTLHSTEYVEVQTVNEEDMVLLHPVSCHGKVCSEVHQTEDYSKVKGMDNDNVLLLFQSNVMEKQVDMCPVENQLTREATMSSYTASITTTPQKPTACIHTALPVLDEQAANGYVDTATMFTVSSY
ncbi:prolactin receptor a [Odontesthes bonariensis]|uniref:prolactin receptor a n=1 Tax=Odontesthes bonariensis TaxID=219752 RepID=UPI003F58DCEF